MNYEYKARLVRVIDGDTVVVDIDLGFDVWMRNQYIRLYGINTPEIRGREREEGLKAKEALSGMLTGGLEIQTIKDRKGKYGRWLGILYALSNEPNGSTVRINLNEWLVEDGYAVREDY